MKPVGVSRKMLKAAYHHGANIARITKQLAGKELMATGNVAPPPEIVEMFTQS